MNRLFMKLLLGLFLFSMLLRAYDMDTVDGFNNTGWHEPLTHVEMGTDECCTYDSDEYTENWKGSGTFNHTGVDIGMGHPVAEGDSVYAISDGTIIARRLHCNNIGSGNPDSYNLSVILVEHNISNGDNFTAIYGHTSPSNMSCNNITTKYNESTNKVSVKKGDLIGTLLTYGDVHLHFGISVGSSVNTLLSGWGRDGATLATHWKNPEIYLSNNSPYNKFLSDTALKQGLNCTNNHNRGLKLAEGVLYCQVENENENGKIDKYNIVVADRNRPYRLRPIVEFTSKNIKYDSELKKYIKNGRFQTRSVLEHIENRGGENSNIIAAINGDAFSVDNKIPYHLGASVFATPSRTLIYGGLNITQSPTIQAMFTFSSSYEKIGIGQLFQNLNGVNDKHNFSKQYHCEFGKNCKNASLKSFIGQGSLSNIAKSHEVEGGLTWTIGLTQGSILGNVYEDGAWKTNQCWKENDSPEDGADYVPILSYSKDRIIMAVSTTKIQKNKHVCELFKTLNMDYAAYLDGGGSTQMIYRFPIEKDYLDRSPNNNDRKVLSTIALVENYSDIDTLAEEYKRAIYYLTDFGIMHGNNGKFGKGFFITRAEFAKMIIKLLTIMQQDMTDTEGTSLSLYIDVDNVDWFRPYAKKVVGLGLMEGNKEKTRLSPRENITYWELSKIISIAFQGKNIKKPIKSKLVEPKNGWHNRYLQCLDNYGKGYSNRFKEEYINIFKDKLQAYYDPNQKIWFSKYATREDVALFLYRAFILWQDGKFDDVSKSCVEK